MYKAFNRWLPVFGLTVSCGELLAKDLYVAPDGAPPGPGTLLEPYDLATALSGAVSQPGDTFWLRGGDHKLGRFNTTIHGAPGAPITFRPVAGEEVRIDGSMTFFDSIGYVVLRDFALYSSNTNRVSAQTGVGFEVTDIEIVSGISCYVPNLSFINLVIHDQTRHGIYTGEDSTNTLVYGCLLFNNGWRSPDNAEGHGLYVQGVAGNRTVAETIVFNNSGVNLHVYEDAPDKSLVGVTLEGNVAFHAGALQTVRPYRDWLIGVDLPATFADGIVLRQNMGFLTPDLMTQPEVQVGRAATNGVITLIDNYLPLGLQMNNWRSAAVVGNLFAVGASNYLVSLNRELIPLEADWHRNVYIALALTNGFLLDAAPIDFPGWQQTTGFDKRSTYIGGGLDGTKVFVRTNAHESGRANIIVYNWDRRDQVTVDIGSAMPLGIGFEVRNAQDFFAPPVLTGTYYGQPLKLPMTNLTVAAPNGPMITPPPTGPTFNVFVLLPQKNPLQVRRIDDSIQVRWPMGFGAEALQWAPDVLSVEWIDSTNVAVRIGNYFQVTEPISPAETRFYRLRTQ